MLLTSPLRDGNMMSIMPRRTLLCSSFSLLDASCWLSMLFISSGEPSMRMSLPFRPLFSSWRTISIAIIEPNEYPTMTKSRRSFSLRNTSYDNRECKYVSNFINMLYKLTIIRENRTLCIKKFISLPLQVCQPWH